MKHPLVLAKSACILLIIALLTIYTALADDTFFNYRHVNRIFFVVLLWTLTSLCSYFITVLYCNKIIGEGILRSPKRKATVFLVLAIISFGFSTCVLITLVAYILNEGVGDLSKLIIDKRGIIEIVTFLAGIIIAILGPVTFFLQLYVRKAFLLKAKTSSDKLIDSIGVNENNSAV